MNSNEFIDARCILLCKSFQAKDDPYKLLSNSLETQWGVSFTQYHAFGEYDKIYSFQLKESEQSILKDIETNNKILTSCVSDSIFFKSLYLLYPFEEQQTQPSPDNFWEEQEPFFFVSTIHTKHCSADFEITKKGRSHIISKIDSAKESKNNNINENLNFKFLVYYSLDLSDYIIIWKTKEPAHVIAAIQCLYEQSDLVGYTNTIYALPFSFFSDLSKTKTIVGKTPFSMSIQAVTQSYKEACKMHSSVEKLLELNNDVFSFPTFSLGSDDYLGFYKEVYPSALYDLYDALMVEEGFKKAVISLNTVLAIEGYRKLKSDDESKTETLSDFVSALDMKKGLSDVCYEVKSEFLSLLNDNRKVFDQFYWRKTLTELLILLDNMSKSTVFDNACFLLLDSIHLFLMFIKHLRIKFTDDKALIYALNNYEIQIETFIREWEHLTNHVVQIDGAFQKTPGYEPLNYNISENIIEFHNAFAQKVISYFSEIDKQSGNKRIPQMSCFVVPKLCRKFKTIQWFCFDREYDGLLFITVPISQIFEIFSNMVALTHEISHYSSDLMRSRKFRKSSFLTCVAALICKYIGLSSNNTIKLAFEILKEYFKNETNTGKDIYLSELGTITKKITFRFLDKTENLSKLYMTYKNDKNENEIEDIAQFAMKIRRSSVHLIGTPSSADLDAFINYCSIYDLIDNLLILFKEGYADVMMIYLLSLKPENYLNESFSDLEQFNTNADRKKIYSKYQRVLIACEALVLAGVWNRDMVISCKLDSNKKQYTYCKEFLDVYSKWINNSIDNQNYYNLFFDKDILNIIISYLKRCVRIAHKNESTQSLALKKEIQEIFTTVTSTSDNGLFSNKFQSVLQKNRSNVIEKWKNRKDNPYTFGEV